MKCLLCLLISLLWLTPAVARAGDPTFAGEWDTTFGRMTLEADAAAVHGTYAVAGGAVNEISGTLTGLTWEFTYTEPGVEGEGSFTLAADGQNFTGRWREKGAGHWQPWTGRRPAAAAGGFSGVWKTTFGPMRLVQNGTAVTGCYHFQGQAELEGTVKGGALKITYTEPTGVKGSAEFTLSKEGKSISGTWKTNDGKQGGEWNGTRVPPVAGRSWLVVLEAHWESNLQQPEYSYGDMLRQFFTRVPGISVRHRYFDDRDDFATWCAELPYLNEPAVVYVASHGSPEGITVGKTVLSGEFIGRQLRHAPEVKLVHLGSCLTMSGPAPAALRKACDRPLPVSGFTKVADWAGSAVIDFAYLDLILSRGMAPGEAVRQISKSVTFAGEQEAPGSAIKPAGLKIVE